MENAFKLTALQPDVLVRLLKQAGGRFLTQEVLQEDFETGAPRTPDGTVNLIEYAAWLAKETEENAD